MNEEEKKISGHTVSEAKFDDKQVKKVAIYSRTNLRDEESVIDVEKETELLMEKIQEHDNWEFYKKSGLTFLNISIHICPARNC